MEKNAKNTPKQSDDRKGPKKKLTLRKQSIRQLDDRALAHAVGGAQPDDPTCSINGRGHGHGHGELE